MFLVKLHLFIGKYFSIKYIYLKVSSDFSGIWYLEESMCFHGKLFSEIITTISVIIYNFLEQWFGPIKSSLYQNIEFVSFSVEQKLWHLGGIHCFCHFIFLTFNEFLFKYDFFFCNSILHIAIHQYGFILYFFIIFPHLPLPNISLCVFLICLSYFPSLN